MPDGVDEMCKGCQVLEKKLTILQKRLAILQWEAKAHENDCACLPEDVSVTEYVTALRAKLQLTQQERDEALATANAYAKEMGRKEIGKF